MENTTKQTLIHIKTTRYSTFLKRIFQEYNTNVEIYIDNAKYTDKDIPQLTNDWCKNNLIQKTIDFYLIRDGIELFSFHDHPSEFFAAISEMQFIKKLAAEKTIRYKITPIKKMTIINKFGIITFVIGIFLILNSIFHLENFWEIMIVIWVPIMGVYMFKK